MSAISIDRLTKEYGEVVANDRVSFTVEEGEVFGYLGPNGAGKTTTIRTLMGLQAPTSGTATVLGADVRDEGALVAARRRIGFLPANPQFDEHVTGAEVIDLHGEVKGDARREELLSLFDVPVDRAVRGYSTGQRQQLGVVLAFMHDPELVVLDEPTSGLDPLVQARFDEFLRAESAAGTTVFLSSHVLSEVRRVCDRVGIVRDGRIVAVERVEDLVGRGGKAVRLRVDGAVDAAAIDLDGAHEPTARSVDGTATELSFTYTGELDALVDFLADRRLLELDVEEAPLEEVFARFYGEAEATDGNGADRSKADGTASDPTEPSVEGAG